MASTDVNLGADVNWPVVVGIGILAAVSFYILYSVNNIVQNVESVTTTPLAGLESGVGQFISNLNPFNWFSGSSDSGADTQGQN